MQKLQMVVQFRSKLTLLAKWTERTMNKNIYLRQFNVLGDALYASTPSELVSAAGWQRNVKVSKAARCPTCFEQAHFALSCQMASDYCRPGVTVCSSVVKETKLHVSHTPMLLQTQMHMHYCFFNGSHALHSSKLLDCVCRTRHHIITVRVRIFAGYKFRGFRGWYFICEV